MIRRLLALFIALAPAVASAQVLNWGDYTDSNQTIYVYFNTVGTDGVAETLTSGALEIYEDGSATQITTAETLDNDFDSITGYHQVAIDLADAGFEAGKTYTVILTAGTVDAVSVVGRIAGVFSIQRTPTTAATEDILTLLGNAPTLAEAAEANKDATLDEPLASHAVGGSVGLAIADSATQASLDTARNDIIAEIGDLQTDVDGIPSLMLPTLTGYSTVLHVPHTGNDATSGTNLRNAITGAGAYTLIRLGSGNYDIGATALSIPNFVSVMGADREASFISSSLASGHSIQPGQLTCIEKVTLRNTSTGDVVGISGSTAMANTVIRNARILGEAKGVTITSSGPCLMTLENVIMRPKTIGVLLTTGAHEIRISDVQLTLFGTTATAGLDVQGASNVRGGDVAISIPESALGAAIRAAGTSKVQLYRSQLYAPPASINIANTATVIMLDGEFNRSLVTGVTENLVDSFSPLRPTTPYRTADVTSTGAVGVDWGNVENPTTTVGLENTSIDGIAGVTFPVDFPNLTLANINTLITTESGISTGLVLAEVQANPAAVWAVVDRDITGGSIDAYVGNTPQTADVAAVTAKLPSDDRNMAGAGDTATNLDEVEGGGGGGESQPRYNFPPEPGFTLTAPSTGTVSSIATPIRLPAGAVGNAAVWIDMSKLYGKNNFVETVDDAAISGGSIVATGLGPRDYYAVIGLTGTATSGETRTVEADVEMVTGAIRRVKFTVIVE
jgi:hypothetical protein